jgi:hypothetical protein
MEGIERESQVRVKEVTSMLLWTLKQKGQIPTDRAAQTRNTHASPT